MFKQNIWSCEVFGEEPLCSFETIGYVCFERRYLSVTLCSTVSCNFDSRLLGQMLSEGCLHSSTVLHVVEHYFF